MIRLIRRVLVIGMVLTACSPTVSGPMPPRPAQLAVTVTTEPMPTTTQATVAGETMDAGLDCPTAFCLVYHLNPRAQWSDGAPVTAEDLAHTVSLNQARARESSGYSLIAGVDVLDDRTALVSFEEPHGAWQTLFGRVFRSGEAPAITGLSTTGPFRFEEWAEGDHMTLTRDPEWWSAADPLSGESPGDVQEITFVFIDDQDAMVDALEDGVVDVIAVRPDIGMVEAIGDAEGIEVTIAPGPFWEHIDFHHDHAILSQGWVREAFTLAIDREKILDRTVRLISPEAMALDNTVFMTGTQGHEPHFEDGFDPGAAEQILVNNGCVRGDDGIHVCDGTRMSFVWGSTNDDPARREIFESAREDLDAVGIEIVADLRSPSAFVTRDFLFGGPEVWQLINFSWRARPDPIDSNSTFYCGEAGTLNVNRYCSEQVEALVRSTENVTDPAARTEVYNRADQAYLGDRALIPLYQKPTLMAWTGELQGPEPNYTSSSDLWNVASWSGKETIVVALPAEPVDMDPLSEADDSANVILGALLYGAFGMSPSHEYVPVLVESVDVIEGNP